MFPLPKECKEVIQRLERNGLEAFCVGGCVRDLLMKRSPSDWDICTNASPHEILDCFQAFPCLETGRAHGTITVLMDGVPFEITTYRREGPYLDHRHPSSVHFVTSLEEDLKRRDFTINAMAYAPGSGLIDLSGGQEDLKKGLLRCVGNPMKRLWEDSLRIMRGLRFSSQLGFSVEEETRAAMFHLKEGLLSISMERITAELYKLLLGKNVQRTLAEYSSILSVILPEITPSIGFSQKNPHHHLDVWEHTCKAVSCAPPDLMVRLTLLFHDLGKPHCFSLDENGMGHFHFHNQKSAALAEEALLRLKSKKEIRETVPLLVLYHDIRGTEVKPAARRLMNRLGIENYQRLLEIKRADLLAQNPAMREEKLAAWNRSRQCFQEILAGEECFTLKDLKIDGNDLIKAGFPRGPQIGKVLNHLLNQVMDERLENRKSALLQSALSLPELHGTSAQPLPFRPGEPLP